MDKSFYEQLSNTMTCGGCDALISRNSDYSCNTCGRMLCSSCSKRWKLCKDHRPMCMHPELIPTQWNQKRPEPERVVGTCIHNYSCPICGFGIGTYPCGCDDELSQDFSSWEALSDELNLDLG